MSTPADNRAQRLFGGRFDVAVVGAGQAGLAIGHELARQGRRFVILERGEGVAPAWRARWDSLALFTPRRYSALPGLPFPGDPDGYPSRDEVVAYLERYAEAFDLPVEPTSEVTRLGRGDDGGFALEVDDRTLTAGQVVVATGPFQAPFVPSVAHRLAADVFQAHAVGYRRPDDVPAGKILVVGGGNTGYQIAKELATTREVVLSVGSRQTPLPQRLLGRDLFWWLTKLRILDRTVDSRLGRRLSTRDTLIGSSPRELSKRFDVELKPRLVDAEGRTARFEDGTEIEVDAVLWATGYRPDYSWIDLPVFDERGRPRHRRGVTDIPGLYFLGLSWQHTRGSALIGWVEADAAFIAGRIARHHDGGGPGKEHTPVAAGATTRAGSPRRGADVHDPEPHRHDDVPSLPRATEGLPDARDTELVELADGAELELDIVPIRKRIADATVRMLGYNGSIPGPTLKVPQGSTITVHVTNHGDLAATVHWHGLRLENRYDGTHETQAAIGVGETFTYRLHVPDPGAYWYHPHIREDYGQELGLYGNILVTPSDPEYWPPANRELLLTLDDVLIEDGQLATFGEETTHVAMGRFGNVMLVAGDPDLRLHAKRGEVVRLYLTNTANTRVFNVALPGATTKLVGADAGRYEHEQLVDEVLLAPSERVVLDVLFPDAGELELQHRTPDRTYRLAAIAVADERPERAYADAFARLRTNPEMAAERKRIEPFLAAPPDKTLSFVAEMDMGVPDGVDVVYVCPMHPEVVRDEPGSCPECGMKLLAEAAQEASYVCPMHPDITSRQPDRCPECGMKLVPASLVPTGGHEHHAHEHEAHGHDAPGHDEPEHAHGGAQGIEWEDDMVEVNRLTTPANMRWKLVDRDTGAENARIHWTFRVGDQVKLRLVNEMDSDHPMPHPFHVHGAGRFLIVARDGVVEPNLVWKDTVLVRTGETVDILLDVTNPGRWMAHCHIAEHHESGMMFSFDVEPA